jgi:parvulin-like peptidyl-prolyl isomerase
VQFELLARDAEQRGLMHSPEVERIGKQAMVQHMLQDLFDRGGVKLEDITQAEIQRYYDEHASDFHKPAQVRASHILFKDRGSAERCLKQLLDHDHDQDHRLRNPQDAELFRKLALTLTQDASTRESAGDLRFFSETPDPAGETDAPKRPAAVRKAAFTLQNIGDIAPQIVQSPEGFHIVQLTGKRDALERSVEDARRMIQNKLWRQRREKAIEDFVADLRQKADVRENRDALAEVQVRGAGSDRNTRAAQATSPR